MRRGWAGGCGEDQCLSTEVGQWLEIDGFQGGCKCLPKESDSFGEEMTSSCKTHPLWSSTGWSWGAGWAPPPSTFIVTPEGAQVTKLRIREVRPLCKVPRLGQSQACLNPHPRQL